MTENIKSGKAIPIILLKHKSTYMYIVCRIGVISTHSVGTNAPNTRLAIGYISTVTSKKHTKVDNSEKVKITSSDVGPLKRQTSESR